MATATIEIAPLPTGLTLTCDLFPADSDTAAESSLALTERTNNKMTYRTSITSDLTGWHRIEVQRSGAPLAGYWVDLDDVTGTYYASDFGPRSSLSSAGSVPAGSSPPLSTGYLYCYGTDGLIESGVDILCRQTDGPGTDGYSYTSTEFTITSDGNGLASHTGFIRGGVYEIRRRCGAIVRVTVPNAASFELPELLGRP